MSFRGLKVTRDCFEMRKTGKGTKSHGHDFFALFLKKKTQKNSFFLHFKSKIGQVEDWERLSERRNGFHH
jgi:hypothetical protein